MAKEQTRSEYSAGGCVYKQWAAHGPSTKLRINGRWTVKWLLGKHSGYHKWVLPKGLIESGEKATSTAIREVEEEMGVKAKIVRGKPVHIEKYVYKADFDQATSNPSTGSGQGKQQVTSKKLPIRRVIKYQEVGGEKTKVFKTVTFYLMEWAEGDPKNHDWEMEEAGWFDFDDAYHKLAFAGEKEALKKAHDTISSE
jgi:8-oxo-dGTP pyrophosphatase MutT (NUDIX family)